MPEVSIVIPHFNRSRLLRDTVDSVHAQQGVDWELIIVDDGSSSDELMEVLKLVGPRVKVLRREDGIKGPSRCRNIGWRAACSNHVMFLDSDDLLAPWCLQKRLRSAAVTQSQGVQRVYPVMLFKNTPGDLNLLWNTMEGGDPILRFLTSDPPWHTSSVLWTREALERLSGFDETVMYGDDAELHARALLSGMRFELCLDTDPDVFIRRSTDSRITNTVSESLLASRLQRLRAGSLSLDESSSRVYREAWQGQYFVECEFLLFRVPDSVKQRRAVIAAWIEDWHPPVSRRCIVRLYLWIAGLTKRHAYLLLRIARRISMLALPQNFFPVGGQFESATLPADSFESLKRRLTEHPTC